MAEFWPFTSLLGKRRRQTDDCDNQDNAASIPSKPIRKDKENDDKDCRAEDTRDGYDLQSDDEVESGLFLLHEDTAAGPHDYDLDIIAVHGLGGDAHKTWTHRDGTLWLRDLLPRHLPGARIYTYGYDSAIAFSQGTGTLKDHARDLLGEVQLVRESVEVIRWNRLLAFT